MIYGSGRFDTEYAEQTHAVPEFACIRLILAIKKQAEQDDKVDEWEAYWLETPPWPQIWRQLLEKQRTQGQAYEKQGNTDTYES